MDGLYAEAAVKVANSLKSVFLRILVIVAVILTFFFAAIINSKLLFVLGMIMAFFAVWLWPRFNMEWEYIFVDGQIDFDTISGGEKRKTRLRIDFDDVEVVAPVGSHALDAYKNCRILDYSSLRNDAKVYVVVGKVGEKGLCQIHFEPSEKMVEMMKQKSPRKVMSI
ncbi:MAG: hypothetical protein E7265_10615 [Lachnospiraceae bacterium]|nr:hypothetical protein [Lachnospiraceae bacterium]